MRMAFGLAGLLVTIGVIAWLLGKVILPYDSAVIKAQEHVQPQIYQISGEDENGVRIEQTYAVYADMRDDGKLQDLQVTRIQPGSPLDAKYGLKPNDVIIAAIDGHTVRTDFAGLDNQEAGQDAIRDAFSTSGQLVVQRGDQKLTLPLPKSAPPPPLTPPPPANSLTKAQQNQQNQNAQKTEQQQEGKSNNGQTDGTMDEINQRLH